MGTGGQTLWPEAAAHPPWACPTGQPLHPVPSRYLAEAAGQPAQRKESGASRQEIEQPGLTERGCRHPAGCRSRVTVCIKEKGESPVWVECSCVSL